MAEMPAPEITQMMEELKEMKIWMAKMMELWSGHSSAATIQALDKRDVEMDDNNNVMDEEVEDGWVNHLKGAQAKPSTPGAASLASLLAIPPLWT